MREVIMAAEVRAELGAEQVARMAGRDWSAGARCWERREPVPDVEPVAVLVLRLADRVPGPRTVVCAHTGCATSQVRAASVDEVAAIQGAAEGAGTVDAVSMLWTTGDGPAYPAVLISYREDAVMDAGPERRDGLVATLLGLGWHPVMALGHAPPPPPAAGWSARYRYRAELDEDAVALVDPAGTVNTVMSVRAAPPWRAAVVRARRLVVIHGAQVLTAGTGDASDLEAIAAAARAGALVAGTVPVGRLGLADLP